MSGFGDTGDVVLRDGGVPPRVLGPGIPELAGEEVVHDAFVQLGEGHDVAVKRLQFERERQIERRDRTGDPLVPRGLVPFSRGHRRSTFRGR